MRILVTLPVVLAVMFSSAAGAQDHPLLPPPDAPAPDGANRVPLEMVGGVGGVLTSLALGVGSYELAGGSDCDYPEEDICGFDETITSMMLGVGSLALTVPLGVYLGGNAGGGNGSFATTFLGSLIGAGAGTLLVAGVASAWPDGALFPMMGVATLLMIGGGIGGYELSNTTRRRSVSATATNRVALSVAPSRAGATVGLAGTF